MQERFSCKPQHSVLGNAELRQLSVQMFPALPWLKQSPCRSSSMQPCHAAYMEEGRLKAAHSAAAGLSSHFRAYVQPWPAVLDSCERTFWVQAGRWLGKPRAGEARGRESTLGAGMESLGPAAAWCWPGLFPAALQLLH